MAKVATRGRARARPRRFHGDAQEDDHDDDDHLDYGEAEPILSKTSKTGYFGVTVRRETQKTPLPFQARVRHGDRMLSLGSFATAEQAARVAAGCVNTLRGTPELAEPPEPVDVTTLVKSKTKTTTGYYGVSSCPSQGKQGGTPRYQAKVNGKYLGKFATPEAAAGAIATQFPELALAQQEEAPPPPPPPPPSTGPRERARIWTNEEDARLSVAVHGLLTEEKVAISGMRAWGRVAEAVGIKNDSHGRGARRCYRRWFSINPENQDVALASRERAALRRIGHRKRAGNNVDDAATDVTEDDFVVDPDIFFSFEDVEDEPPPPPPKPAMRQSVVDACRLDACREDVGIVATFTFGLSNLGRRSFSFSPPSPPPAPTLKRLLDFDGAITAYAQIKKKRSTK